MLKSFSWRPAVAVAFLLFLGSLACTTELLLRSPSDEGAADDLSHTVVVTEQCAGTPPSGSPGTCTVTGGSTTRDFVATVLTPGHVYVDGHVVVDGNGKISCVGCGCDAPGATRVTCAGTAISPGLINPHDHITFQAGPTAPSSDERYEHRHDWRVGENGHTRVGNNSSSADTLPWAELRMVLAGTTSVAGSNAGVNGLARNLDCSEQLGAGLSSPAATSKTFPLNDSSGTQLTSGCGYSRLDANPGSGAYLIHVGEGIGESARNELRCTAFDNSLGKHITGPKTSIVHGVGFLAADIAELARQQTRLVWSPRSNVSLYGDTAPVMTYARMGVPIALGTDWLQSGSMNSLREIKCADGLNRDQYGSFFTDEALWRMVTVNAADAVGFANDLGTLAAGKVADLALFREKDASRPFRVVIDANAEDVLLTVRGGKVLSGDRTLVHALTTDACDDLDLCGEARAVCLKGEIGITLKDLQAKNASTYPLDFCGGQTPRNEPSCVPSRSAKWTKLGSSAYSGASSTGDEDGDGVSDAVDDCPHVFNPIRPLDGAKQEDADGDGTGDACDATPTGGSSSHDGGTDGGTGHTDGGTGHSDGGTDGGTGHTDGGTGNTAGLLVNEVDYDQTSTDLAEFVELYNGGSTPVDLSGLAVTFVKSSGGEYFPLGGTTRIALTQSGRSTLGPGEYLVIHSAGMSVPSGTAEISLTIPSGGWFFNSVPSAVGIVNVSTGKLVDSISYGGTLNGISLSGLSGTFDFAQGTGDLSSLRDTTTGAIGRCPSGATTHVTAADLRNTSAPTPGADNGSACP